MRPKHAILDQVPDVDRVRHRRGEPAGEGLDERKPGNNATALAGGKRMGLHRISSGSRGGRLPLVLNPAVAGSG